LHDASERAWIYRRAMERAIEAMVASHA